MTPSEARSKLLQQHDRLRELVGHAGDLAARLLRGEFVLVKFSRALLELRNALRQHNQAEEALLEPLLRSGDAAASLRVNRMTEEHATEHAVMRAVLVGTGKDVAVRMADFAEDLLAHMAAEERTFLSPAVLRDDIINIDASE